MTPSEYNNCKQKLTHTAQVDGSDSSLNTPETNPGYCFLVKVNQICSGETFDADRSWDGFTGMVQACRMRIIDAHLNTISFADIAPVSIPAPPAERFTGFATKLICWPPINPNERDPITRIFVTFTEAPSHMTIMHESAARRRFDRTYQYTNTSVIRGNYGPVWTGTLISNPRRSIVSAVQNDEGRYVYTENYFLDERSISGMEAPCQVN